MKRMIFIALLALVWVLNGMAEGTADVPGAFDEANTAPEPAAFTEADAPYDGVWQPFEDGFRLYLPRGWMSMDLTEAQMEAGLFYRAGSAGGAGGVAVGYMSAGDLKTVDALAGDFERSGYTGVVVLDLNGIPAIGFERPRDAYRGVAFFHPVYPDYVLYVYVSPLNSRDAGGQGIGEALLASISPVGHSSDVLKNN